MAGGGVLSKSTVAGDRRSSGFSMVELLIVVSIIGALTSVCVPLFMEHKEKATLGVSQSNLAVVRSALAHFAAKSENNLYPVGVMDYAAFRAAVPEINLPPIEADAKFVVGSYRYSSDGTVYVIHAISANRTASRFLATPAGILAD